MLLTTLLSLPGCLLPEVDTPPIDPALVEGSSAGSGGSTACVEGIYKGSVNLTKASALSGYADECTIKGNVTISLDFTGYKTLAAVREIQGSLTIRGNGTGKAVSPVPSLERINGSLSISGTKLVHMPVFPRLETVTNAVHIIGNSKMAEVHGLDALTQVVSIRVENNAIATWTAFGKVKSLAGDVRINNNWNLKQVSLPTVQRFSQLLYLGNNKAMTQFSIPNTTYVSIFSISDNQALTKVVAPKVNTLGNLSINTNSKVNNAALQFGKVGAIAGLNVTDQPMITALTWLGLGPKLTGPLYMCKTGMTSAAAMAWLKKKGGTPTEKFCN